MFLIVNSGFDDTYLTISYLPALLLYVDRKGILGFYREVLKPCIQTESKCL